VSISDIAANTSVLLMLSDNCCLPCYTFDSKEECKAKLSPKNLRHILLWAANAEPKMPELLFLAGDDEPLEPSIASVLVDMGDQVVTPLLSIDKQKSLGIPFSRNQTVVARNLSQLVTHAEDIAGRSVILHIERTEIGRLAESLLYIQDYLGAITLRLRDVHLLGDDDLQSYEQQLASIADIGLMKQAAGTEGKLRLLNLSALGAATSRTARCPAGKGFVTIGPDGCIYPCPAFYRAGKEYSLGSIRSRVNEPADFTWNRQHCGICGSTQCPGCPFLESSELAGKEQVCRVYEAEDRATQELLLRVARSGYLFDCLRTLKARECAAKSQREGGEGFAADLQVYDITFGEFVQALHDLKLATESLADKSSENDNYDSILNRWSELPEIPSTSQRSVFRRRVLEILTELRQLRNLTFTANQNRSLTKA